MLFPEIEPPAPLPQRPRSIIDEAVRRRLRDRARLIERNARGAFVSAILEDPPCGIYIFPDGSVFPDPDIPAGEVWEQQQW